MNYGVFRSFVESEEEEEVINILENIERTQDVKDVKIKSANAKTVIYIVTSDKRFDTQTLLNQQLSDAGFNVSKVFVSSISNSCLLYTSPSPRDSSPSRMPSSA